MQDNVKQEKQNWIERDANHLQTVHLKPVSTQLYFRWVTIYSRREKTKFLGMLEDKVTYVKTSGVKGFHLLVPQARCRKQRVRELSVAV